MRKIIKYFLILLVSLGLPLLSVAVAHAQVPTETPTPIPEPSGTYWLGDPVIFYDTDYPAIVPNCGGSTLWSGSQKGFQVEGDLITVMIRRPTQTYKDRSNGCYVKYIGLDQGDVIQNYSVYGLEDEIGARNRIACWTTGQECVDLANDISQDTGITPIWAIPNHSKHPDSMPGVGEWANVKLLLAERWDNGQSLFHATEDYVEVVPVYYSPPEPTPTPLPTLQYPFDATPTPSLCDWEPFSPYYIEGENVTNYWYPPAGSYFNRVTCTGDLYFTLLGPPTENIFCGAGVTCVLPYPNVRPDIWGCSVPGGSCNDDCLFEYRPQTCDESWGDALEPISISVEGSGIGFGVRETSCLEVTIPYFNLQDVGALDLIEVTFGLTIPEWGWEGPTQGSDCDWSLCLEAWEFSQLAIGGMDFLVFAESLLTFLVIIVIAVLIRR